MNAPQVVTNSVVGKADVTPWRRCILWAYFSLF